MSLYAEAAVLGSPIEHSKSPQLHGAAYQHLGLEIDYRRIEVNEATLSEFIDREAQQPGWLGWSCTMPLKSAMVEHMDSISPRVQTLGVLNTVVHSTQDGQVSLHGENTDVDGIVAALTEAGLSGTPSTDPHKNTDGEEPLPFGLIGAGGTAAAALAAAAELGFTTVVAYVRSFERAVSLEPVAEALGLFLLLRPLESLGEDLQAGRALAAVVSTLPPRAADPLTDTFTANAALAGTVLLDVAYDPWPSQLAITWQLHGGTVVSGLQMLLHQAVRQVELFTADTANPALAQNQVQHAQMVDAMRIGLKASTL